MRKVDWRIIIGVGIVGVVCLVWLLVTGGLIWAALEEPDREAVINAVGPRVVLLVVMWAVSLAAVGAVLRQLVAYFMTAPARLAEEAQVLLGTDVKRRLVAQGSVENRRLTDLFNQLVEQREALRSEMDVRVQEASRNTEMEKSRLAALMSELTKSVVVCNLDGRILLYNNRARMQFRALSKAPGVAGGAELVGLGRSIYSVFDRKLVTHALENIQHRLQRGAASPSAQFVTTTHAGQLLRVQMAPVRAVQSPDGAADIAVSNDLTGFVLMLDNITREFEADSEKDRVLYSLTEGSRAALANAQAAVEVLEYPDIEAEMRERLLHVIREEIQGLGKRIDEMQTSSTNNLRSRWPLEDMLGADFIEAAVRRIETSLPVRAEWDAVDTSLWLKVESFSLLQALVHLSSRLNIECGVDTVQLRLAENAQRAQLDLLWTPQTPDIKAMMNWELEQIRSGSETLSLTVQDVLTRHGGDSWYERDADGVRAFFRFLLPLAAPQEELASATFLRNESRPEYYDFDLFQSSEQSRSLEDRLLTELTYTVFDTETTGLNPAGGDEIIQVGAVRIVNGKLLQQEFFDQLVDPKRTIPAETIPIHGIKPEMVKGQPTIGQVLPAFHTFAQDTVLVAHNAAFDMRCLQVKEKATGIVFDHPVLDTLLLSAVLHPNQESHRLEAIAERFNVTVIGRHTALGDSIVTAEVFLKLIPLLAEKGILTLRQAREEAQKTFYARLKY
ncbi:MULTISPECIES: exonuclease domain-containing protein [Thiothrix]|jgi:DNA polymerase-3 subunit epsilon|uniref:DNA-directed DNA polymerase n=1 Tax=Thiothrix lacustris TaxID=525917 RepID=A0A1Y1QR40_9GAMM|nr:MULTISPECIES: exonuclease domain-containing protein [Thiothrix]MDX9987066.1 exonuclease domain-containing protein [Thiothrix unzii]OQX11873.1 MAG: DNA polymerase III subunit epsilon [Thiothrix lacustris]